MYVCYYDFGEGDFEIIVVTNHKPNPADLRPSDCIWMVPGTVDPRED